MNIIKLGSISTVIFVNEHLFGLSHGECVLRWYWYYRDMASLARLWMLHVYFSINSDCPSTYCLLQFYRQPLYTLVFDYEQSFYLLKIDLLHGNPNQVCFDRIIMEIMEYKWLWASILIGRTWIGNGFFHVIDFLLFF